MSSGGPRSRILARLAKAGALAGAFLCALEIALIAARQPPGLANLALLALAVVCLTVPVVVVLVVLASPLALVARLARWRGERGLWRWLLSGLFLAGAGVIQVVNATAYVRLYLALHLALSLLALVSAQVGFFLLVRARPVELTLSRARSTIVVGAALLWLAGFGGALVAIANGPVLRVIALDHTTLLAHELLLLDRLTGIMAPPEYSGADADPEVLATMLPRAPGPPSGQARGANVVLLTVDALRGDSLAAMPGLERRAATAALFSRAYAPGCWTIHSTWSLLTSRLSSSLDYTFVSVSPDWRFTPHARDSELVSNPFNRAKVTPVPFDDATPTLTGRLGEAGYESATMASFVFQMRDAGISRDFAIVDETAYRRLGKPPSAPMLTDWAIDFLKQRDPRRPYFIWLHYMEPHAPYVDHAGNGGGPRARYESELGYVDKELGRLLDHIDATDDDTIVIVHGDHGEEFGDHGGQYHATTVYDEQVRVPMLWLLPQRAGARRGAKIARPVSLLDIAPTVLDLVGLESDVPMVGRSLVAALMGAAAPARPVVAECYRFGRKKRAVVDWPYKLVVDFTMGTAELYDLARDPRERRNLVEAEPATFDRMVALLVALDQ